ncbi:MAG: hypothetical protein JKY26_06660 [Pseudomonas sp.]|nr:hypothetical protein [Pseudomonas sp.]
MISIVQRRFKQASDTIKNMDKQVAFATAVALTRTAGHAKTAITDHMPQVLDRPTKFTLNSMFVLPAKRDKPIAYVRMKGDGDRGAPAAKWLNPQIDGKARLTKGSEKRLRAKGVLPNNKSVVPAKGMKLDRYGNISRRAMRNIIEGLDSGSRYFVLGSEDDPIGIAERKGRKGARLVLAFVSTPNYRRRLDFYGVGNKAIDRNLDDEFIKAYKQALATARV